MRDSGSNKIDVSGGAGGADEHVEEVKSGEGKSGEASKTEEMQQQAPAATEKGKVEKVKEAAQKVVGAAVGEDEGMGDEHDEL